MKTRLLLIAAVAFTLTIAPGAFAAKVNLTWDHWYSGDERIYP